MPEVCECGHDEDEHGMDQQYPGSSACSVPGCDCIAYEGVEEEG